MMCEKQILFCRKCRRFWERGYFDELSCLENKIKYYVILGRIDTMDLSISEEMPSGHVNCPECDIFSWVNIRNVDGKKK